MFHEFALGEPGERGERGFPGRGVKGFPGPRGLPGKYKRLRTKQKRERCAIKNYSEWIPQATLNTLKVSIIKQ